MQPLAVVLQFPYHEGADPVVQSKCMLARMQADLVLIAETINRFQFVQDWMRHLTERIARFRVPAGPIVGPGSGPPSAMNVLASHRKCGSLVFQIHSVGMEPQTPRIVPLSVYG